MPQPSEGNLREDCIFEKKKWISITGLCNNNCLFCLDGSRADNFHKKKDEILGIIKKARDDGCTKLVLSGGEPTIHPDIIDFVAHAKGLGFGKIQVISNGRMFASKEFTKRIIDAGLNEVTFSIHGHTAELHDGLTRSPGSFSQIISGLMNVRQFPGVIVNTDTTINGLNYKFLPDITGMILGLGIREINLMSIVPAGNARDNSDFIMYEFEDVVPFVKQVIKMCKESGAVLWFSRFPAKYLEGNEEYIEDPYKMVDDIRGMADKLFKSKERPDCYPKWCGYCGIAPICGDIVRIAKEHREGITPSEEERSVVRINAKNYKRLADIVSNLEKKNVVFDFTPPDCRVSEYPANVPRMSDAVPYIAEAARLAETYEIVGIPRCICPGLICSERAPSTRKTQLNPDGSIDFVKVAEELAPVAKVKPLSCRSCIAEEMCSGLYIRYMKAYSSREIDPIRMKEIRINLDCNQSCLFCNTDEDAENVITDSECIKKTIRKWRSGGANVLVISGKEPTLDKNLCEYIELAKSVGYKGIELQTNAILLADKEFASKIIKSGLNMAFVSVHAHNEEMSSKITRAPGTFSKTVSGIKNLIDGGTGITVNVVINKINYRNAEDVAKFVHANFKGIRGIVFSFVSPTSHAWANHAEIIPKISDAVPYLKKAFDFCLANKISFRVPSRCGIPVCFMPEYREFFDEYVNSSRWLNPVDKKKLDKCRTCEFESKCNGIWERYIKIHGTEEFSADL
jgi:MoaA/NifB/PqqE/SkfB family radical SAM enzyme